MNLDLATLSSFGITFYDDKDPEGSTTDALEDYPELLPNLSETFPSYNGDEFEEICAAAVSPALSDILHEFSVPDGIRPVDKSMEDSVSELIPCDQCSAVEDTPHNIPEESISIGDGDESILVEAVPEKSKNRPGRKRLPKAKVIPGKWYCSPCNKNFMSKGGLSQHANSRHAKDKTHVCEMCSKRFQFPGDLEEHRARHSAGNKPLECSYEGCHKRFVRQFDLNRHFMQNHGIPCFSCRLCEKRFGRKDHLELHLVSHKNKTVRKM